MTLTLIVVGVALTTALMLFAALFKVIRAVSEDRRGDQEIRDYLYYLDANARPARLLAR